MTRERKTTSQQQSTCHSITLCSQGYYSRSLLFKHTNADVLFTGRHCFWLSKHNNNSLDFSSSLQEVSFYFSKYSAMETFHTTGCKNARVRWMTLINCVWNQSSSVMQGYYRGLLGQLNRTEPLFLTMCNGEKKKRKGFLCHSYKPALFLSCFEFHISFIIQPCLSSL